MVDFSPLEPAGLLHRRGHLKRFADANALDFGTDVGPSPVPALSGGRDRDRLSWSAAGLEALLALNVWGYQDQTQTRYLGVRLPSAFTTPNVWFHQPGGWGLYHAHGPDLFDGRPYSLRTDALEADPRALDLFDDPVVALLLERDLRCDAAYLDGWFVGYYARRWHQPDQVRHAFALADAVAASAAGQAG